MTRELSYQNQLTLKPSGIDMKLGVKATKDRIELKLRGLKAEKAAIQLELDKVSNNRALLKEMREAEDQIWWMKGP